MSDPDVKPSEPSPPPPGPPLDRAALNAQMRRRQILGAMIVALLLLSAGGWAFWSWEKNRLPDEPLVDVPARGGGGFFAGGGGPPMRQPPREGVRKNGNNFELRCNGAIMFASLNGEKNWQLAFRYQPAKFSSPDEVEFLTARYQTIALKLTDGQKAQLAALPPYPGGMAVAPADRAQMETLWASYIAAKDDAKPGIEKSLVDMLTKIAEKSVAPTLAATDAYVAKVRAILTPEQITMLEQRGPRRALLPRAATQASTTPPTPAR